MTPSRRARKHVYTRPTWLCANCAAPWPCQPAKLDLLREYRDDRLALMVYLGEVAAMAVAETPVTENIVARFLLWARPQSSSAD